MLVKRIIFVLVLALISIICIFNINQRFDPFSRYQYADQIDKELLLTYLDDEDISYITQYKVHPDRFIKYLGLENFDMLELYKYEIINDFETDLEKQISFVNNYNRYLATYNLRAILNLYGFDSVSTFFMQKAETNNDLRLMTNVINPLLELKANETYWTYQPKDLVPVSGIPSTNDNILVSEYLIEPLTNLCSAIEISEETPTCDNLVVVRGYTSPEKQAEIYEKLLLEVGIDKVDLFEAKPGQSPFQLGLSVQLYISTLEPSLFSDSTQVSWLLNNAHLFGFVMSENELIDGVAYQPMTLHYVGVEEATRLYNDSLNKGDSDE